MRYWGKEWDNRCTLEKDGQVVTCGCDYPPLGFINHIERSNLGLPASIKFHKLFEESPWEMWFWSLMNLGWKRAGSVRDYFDT